MRGGRGVRARHTVDPELLGEGARVHAIHGRYAVLLEPLHLSRPRQ